MVNVSKAPLVMYLMRFGQPFVVLMEQQLKVRQRGVVGTTCNSIQCKKIYLVECTLETSQEGTSVVKACNN